MRSHGLFNAPTSPVRLDYDESGLKLDRHRKDVIKSKVAKFNTFDHLLSVSSEVRERRFNWSIRDSLGKHKGGCASMKFGSSLLHVFTYTSVKLDGARLQVMTFAEILFNLFS